jgi:tetratricopeptide (TPR) repeat protein
MPNWNSFHHDAAAYIYAGASLQENWHRLHLGDCEPYPDAEHIESSAGANSALLPTNFDGDYEVLAARIRKAWRHYHCGEFQLAVETADQCGLLGHAVANKATGVYASYLETDEDAKQVLLQQAIVRAESAIEALPDDANAWYFHAFNLGRYSQSISIGKALKQGLAGKVLKSLKTTLELQPSHAEAHTAVGLYHSEIIDKVGKLIGSMTYGASADTAIGHFQAALAVTPEAPIAHIEYGNGLYMLYADKRLDDVTDAYISASELSAFDAMEKLDIEFALTELE